MNNDDRRNPVSVPYQFDAGALMTPMRTAFLVIVRILAYA
jgi:hypothetical protein